MNLIVPQTTFSKLATLFPLACAGVNFLKGKQDLCEEFAPAPSLTDPTGMLVDVNCQQVTVEECAQTVTDINNREGHQFQVSPDDKTGQLSVVGDVDSSKLSDTERVRDVSNVSILPPEKQP